MQRNRLYNFSNFIAEDLQLPLTYLDPLIPVNSATIFFGPFKSYKSVIVQQMAIDIASGRSFLNLFDVPVPKKVLYLQNELADVWLQDRWRTMIKNYSDCILDNLYYHNCKGMFLNNETTFNQLCEIIGNVKPDVVIIDSLYYTLIGDVSDGGVVNEVIRKCDRILTAYAPVSIVLVHHQRKTANDRPDLGMEEMLGSVQLAAWPSVLIKMKCNEGDQKQLQFLFRYHPNINPIEVRLNKSKFILETEDNITPMSIESGISTTLCHGELRCYDEIFRTIRNEIGVSRTRVRGSINAMLKMGRLTKVSIDGSELYSLVSVRVPDSQENKNQ